VFFSSENKKAAFQKNNRYLQPFSETTNLIPIQNEYPSPKLKTGA
jgi:hypothetical protein